MLVKKSWLGFLFAFLLPIVLIFAWWGAFNHTDVRETHSAPMRYAYVDFYGNLADVSAAQDKLRAAIIAQRIEPGDPVVVLFTDPRVTKTNEQQAQIGYVIAPNAGVARPLKSAVLPARNVLQASVRASMGLAPGMAYQALYNYLKPQGKDIRLPTVERYTPGTSINQMGTLTVDMPD
jgi:effector-binding domain-containing protein